jgi:bifunctional UDP-N-acetylglucosamine pyrophosphorylase/glucosamine-1-phosphate N-acetyltransferase
MATLVASGAKLAVLGFDAANPTGYGRLLMRDDQIVAIREHADCSLAEREITLCNSGVMAFDADLLRKLLPKIGNDNAKAEYYLTDMVQLANDAGERVVLATCPENEVLGVNTRAELAGVEAEFQRRYRLRAMQEGATLVAPETVFLSHDTHLGEDVLVEPHVVMGEGVSVGDNSVVRSFCHLENARISANVVVGPFARIRPGTELATGVNIGNFVEVKNARIGAGSKVNHLSYVGDAIVGPDANIGAGTITCNFDGYFKHVTEIGAGAFVGSNTALVAPVRIGENAYVGSGSVVTKDVPDGALAVGRGRQENRENWAIRYDKMQKARKAGKKR